MHITRLHIRNYRTLENIEIAFPSSYAAICGPNDSGKTNVIRAIRALVHGENRRGGFVFPNEDQVSLKDDFPKWSKVEPAEREIVFSVGLSLDATRDVGYYEFVAKQLGLQEKPPTLALQLEATYRAEGADPEVKVAVGDKPFGGLEAQEVLKKLQSSRSILFHNSTAFDTELMYPGRSVAGYIREITGQHAPTVANLKKTVDRGLAKISKAQQTEFEDLLGRLSTKYKVGLSMPGFDFGYMPFSITLGDKTVEVPLDDWGSGTRNRTMVLLALFRARQIAGSDPSAGKI